MSRSIRRATRLRPVAAPGDGLGRDLTVLGVLDGGSVEPTYIAWHRANWCPVVCKVMTSPQRARREAEVIGRMAHPNIVRALGVDGGVHLLMPYYPGPTLDRLVKRPGRRIGVSDAMRLAFHVGAALVHVHGRGFLHMDVKPGNIIVAPGGHPVLFDFGSARAIGTPGPGEPIGTDPYIAPEECLLGKASPANDIFSLGVTIYEMLTGRLPFAEPGKSDEFPQVTADAEPMRAWRRGLARSLDDLVLRCLDRNPEKRPSLAALLPELNRHIVSGPRMWPAGFSPQDAARPHRKTSKRRRRALAPA